MFKLKNVKFKKYLLAVIFMATGLITNNPIFGFNSRENFVLSELQSNYLNKIKDIQKNFSEYNTTEAKLFIQEMQKKLIELNKKIKKEKNPEKLKTLKQNKQILDINIDQITQDILQQQRNYEKLKQINQQLNYIKQTIKILDIEKNKENKKILSKNTIKDLEIFNTINSDESLFNILDNTLTPSGKIQLALELDLKRTNKEKLEKKTNQINELLNNEELFSNLKTSLENNAIYLQSYLINIQELNNTETEKSLEKFLYDSEKKLSYYLKKPMLDGWQTASNNLRNKLIISCLPLIPSIFKGGFFDEIEGLNSVLKEAFRLKTYKNSKFFASFISQLTLTKLPSILNLAGSIGLQFAATKYLDIPYAAFNMATAPIYGLVGMKKSIQNQYKIKQEFKNKILQKFYDINQMISLLEDLYLITQSNKELKSLTKNIGKLVNYEKDDALGQFLKQIKNVDGYELYKDKEIIQNLYKKYIDIFIKMKSPEYKKLISKAIRDLGKIDVLLSKIHNIKFQEFNIPTYIEQKGKPYIYLKNPINVMDTENSDIFESEELKTKIENISNEELDLLKMLGMEIPKPKKTKKEKIDNIIELKDYDIIGADFLKNNLKNFVYNIILGHIGIVRADKAIITPLDNIVTMLNKINLENLKSVFDKAYKFDNLEKSLIISDNQKLEELLKKENLSTNLIYQGLFKFLTSKLIPSKINSYYFIT
ncbi:hypothetical protein GF385_01135 [Candidatus Dependentiae bacterium]|nr:hypothetical protein [Candidatus Dependentiae bacterium]